jgi:hypothetical protein
MNRRVFVSGLLNASALAQSGILRVDIQPQMRLGRIPADFMGLGYEVSSVSERGLLAGSNRRYVEMVRGLSREGVIRIGGNTSDYAAWSPAGPAVSSPKGSVVDRRGIDDLGTFLRATGWRVIWGFNLGRGSVDDAVNEAAAVASATGDRLFAFEIGNEPDLFPGVHRAAGYSYAEYYAEYQRFKKAIRAKLPNAPFAGPDVIVHADWLEEFARVESSDIQLLTYHFYPEGPPDNPSSTIETLMKPSPILLGLLARLQAASRASGVPYRICETNSCFGGGKPGVSDTMASALWGLDYMFTLALFGAAGVNMETGVNHLGFLSYYTPMTREAVRPLYYGMLAFAMASRGERVQASLDAAGLNMAAYAVRSDAGEVWVTLINKEANHDATVRATCPGISTAHVARLTAPSLESKEGVRLSELDALKSVRVGELEIHVPRASAAIIRLRSV